MTGRLLVLGPQHPRPNLPAVLDEIGVEGPLAVLTAGWRHDEAELEALSRATVRPLVPLPLYRWFDELEQSSPELVGQWHERQARVRAFKRAYAIEMRAAMEVQARLEASAGADRELFEEEQAYAREAVRVLDHRAVRRLDEMRARFPRSLEPWRDPAVAPYLEALQERMEGCGALCIAGGHAAVLLNRIQFFGLERLLPGFLAQGGHLLAWSAGAMVLTDRIVLFYDDPPEGSGDPEVLDRGLGLVPRVVLLPHARRRLNLDSAERVHRMAVRFHPAACLALENGAVLELVDGELQDRGRPGAVRQLEAGGLVRCLTPCLELPPPDPVEEGAAQGLGPASSPDLRTEDRPVETGGRAAFKELAAALSKGGHTGRKLKAFLEAHQFPLVDERVATFVFHDGHKADEVKLVHWVFGLESKQALQRLPGTDAWFVDVELPPKARVEYKFDVMRGGHGSWVRDPLNPRQAFDPFGSNSVCPMPGYQAPPWVQREPHVRRGRLESFVLRSAAYGDERPIVVYLPHEFRPQKHYPLLICQDGSDYRRYAEMVSVLDNLIHRHEVRPLIVAFTDGVARNQEYGANPQQVRFLVDELLPELARRFPLSENPRERGLMGASFGGVSSLYTAWTRPEVFGRLLLQSGSFVFTDVGHHGRGPLWDPIVRFVNDFRQDPSRIKARVFMSCGRFEGLISYNRAMVQQMRAAGLELRFEESDDGHNWICWRDHLRKGLTSLFPGHLWMVYD